MPKLNQKELTWDKKGVERMEFFMAEQIAFYITEQVLPDWSGHEDKLIDELRCVQGAPTDPEFLSMSIPVAGNVMGNMMAQGLMKLLLSPDTISGIVYDAIARAIKDEEYDRLHSDYDMP
ncbi:MAG: hypothetical protein OXE95_07340 [Chloroflexi bacterium]|nr:hypothetical protein [Chloroflexota bacterium]MCY4247369.1 hypothetical protein [Chloroflexota bacterium]